MTGSLERRLRVLEFRHPPHLTGRILNLGVRVGETCEEAAERARCEGKDVDAASYIIYIIRRAS